MCYLQSRFGNKIFTKKSSMEQKTGVILSGEIQIKKNTYLLKNQYFENNVFCFFVQINIYLIISKKI